MLSLIRFKDQDAAIRYLSDYGAPAKAIIEAVGGKPVWAGQAQHVLVDTTGTGWDLAVLVWYPSRAAFVRLMEHPDHKALLPARDACVDAAIQMAANDFIFDLAR